MTLSRQLDDELLRLRFVLVVMLGALLFLGTSLWRIQVRQTTEYSRSLDRQSMRRVRIPASRGAIFDRSGVCLVDNRPSYGIAVYIEELRRPGRWENTVEAVEELLDRLAAVLQRERQVGRDDIRNHIRLRLPLPFLAWEDVGQETLARWAENAGGFPGVDIYVSPVRTNHLGGLAAHVLGYVGRAQPRQDPERPYHFYLAEKEGKTGVEYSFNEMLSGIPGGRLIRVDASGYRHEESAEREPLPGRDLTLTLDARMQSVVEKALEGQRGAGVLLDPRNGDVLAMASSPGFDPNVFAPAVSDATWRELNRDPGKPLFNRAVSGAYPPGSTFKPLVGIAALEAGHLPLETAFDCTGAFALGGTVFRCWRRTGHGPLKLRKALEQSCNVYFYHAALRSGYEAVRATADAANFGRRTGIALAYESRGLVPDDAWKRRVLNDAWRGGDTCNVSIGQGALLATPLQMALFTAQIANGGILFRPRIVRAGRRSDGDVLRRQNWSEQTLAVVRAGMRDVVEEDTGTGKRARIPAAAVGGKTGTAEYGPQARRKKHAWMIAFAPFDSPRYALALVLEDAVSGGISAAPRVREILSGLFAAETGERAPGGTP